MIVVYCYIGPVPNYLIETIQQTRLFFKGDIICILTDIHSPIVKRLKEEGIRIILYEKNVEFDACIKEHGSKFSLVPELGTREKLFIYAFERFFALYSVMRNENWKDVVFLELDNLIYDDPIKWLAGFQKKPMAYMYDNELRCASGICYIQHADILYEFTQCCLQYIRETDIHRAFMTEMQALHAFWIARSDLIQLLPIHWPSPTPHTTWETYGTYGDSIFDAAALGIYLCGMDPIHTGGIVKTGLGANWSAVNYTTYEYKWEDDKEGRMIPYVMNGSGWVRINNLHVHSKNLTPYLSIHN